MYMNLDCSEILQGIIGFPCWLLICLREERRGLTTPLIRYFKDEHCCILKEVLLCPGTMSFVFNLFSKKASCTQFWWAASLWQHESFSGALLPRLEMTNELLILFSKALFVHVSKNKEIQSTGSMWVAGWQDRCPLQAGCPGIDANVHYIVKAEEARLVWQEELKPPFFGKGIDSKWPFPTNFYNQCNDIPLSLGSIVIPFTADTLMCRGFACDWVDWSCGLSYWGSRLLECNWGNGCLLDLNHTDDLFYDP